MAVPGKFCVCAFVGLTVALLEIHGMQAEGYNLTGDLSRKSFPKGFVFGTASSAYQYEGAAKADGRGPSIWDTFSHQPAHIVDLSNGDVAVDEYHRYKEDVELMDDMGMDAYRFSISWSRIFPNGSGYINQAGVDYYNRLIDALLDKGFEAPGRCSIFHHTFCKSGDSSTEPYIVAHNVLLSHATVVETYRNKYKKTQGGSIGIAFDVVWYEPLSNSSVDVATAQVAQDFQFGW